MPTKKKTSVDMKSIGKTSIGDKSIMQYWEVAKLPVYVSIGLSVLSLLLLFAGAFALGIIAIIGLVALAVWLWLGWRAVKEFGYDLKDSAIAGAVGGVVSGIVGAVISIIQYSVLASTMAGIYGASYATMAGAGMVTSAVLSPVWGAIFGAILAAVGAFIAANMK
ncbi:MAG: hypothetical protein V1881_00570 [Candidatus Micrarchaeota archaeon]